MNSDVNILIVDDSAYLRKLIHNSLADYGFKQLLEACDGKEALDKMMEHEVNLIISGIHMAKVNGLELLRAIRNHSGLKQIPFIVLTSEPQGDMFRAVMQAGATGYLKKPFNDQDLIAKIESILE